ncbi:tetratricopeptide repeat protein [Nocardia sp. NPDC005998]|uniref:ATP-binding protein n=1 Tax=Nocardia sp. NPDC005998 TaxID=3156894 RepID=UPI0033BC2AD0
MSDFRARDSSQQVNVIGSNTGTFNLKTLHEAPPPPRPVVTTALRRDTKGFLGRDDELQQILDAAGPTRVVSIHTIDGMPGVGKTALAIRAAHVLAERFPDGRYFVELHAHTPGQAPADPANVLATLLTDLGIDPRNLPDTVTGRSNLWRDWLADKKVLLVLDDAATADQIEPLLPAGDGCFTLVTSRRRLVALDDAMPLALDILDPGAAIDLFITLARRDPDDNDRAAAAQIVQLCGYLPLAIVLLAGRLAHHRVWTIAALAAEFAATGDRLTELDTGERAVRAAFTMSYRDLPSQRARVFRCLGLCPGPDIDVHAAAALAGISVREARAELEELYNDHLIEETTLGRYRLHDLLCDYARALAETDPPDDNNRALDRLLDHYQVTAAAANQHLARITCPITQPDSHPPAVPRRVRTGFFRDEKQALAWMRTERANLLACLEVAADRHHPQTPDLAGALAGLLERDGPWPHAVAVQQRTVVTAHDLGDRLGEAKALSNLGNLHRLTGDHAAAAERHQHALEIYRKNGDRDGEATAYCNLGNVRRSVGDHAGAVDLYQQALDICCDIGFSLGEATALNNLGNVHRLTGAYGGAVMLHEQALRIYVEIGNEIGEANTRFSLGNVHRLIGDNASATDLYQKALAAYRKVGYRLGEANTLSALGNMRELAEDSNGAARLHKKALEVFRDIGFRLGEAAALGNLGNVRRSTGDHERATGLYLQALDVYHDIGYRVGEAEVLNTIGDLMIATGEPHGALVRFTDALDVARRIGNPLEQARALEGAARCRAHLGETALAATEQQEADEIYQSLAAPAAESAITNLVTLEYDQRSH